MPGLRVGSRDQRRQAEFFPIMDLTPQAARGSNCQQGSEKALFYWQFEAAMTDTIIKDRNPKEIEVTPEMADAGANVIFQTDGVAPLGVFFSGPDLAEKVYRAMECVRLQPNKEQRRNRRARQHNHGTT